MPGKISGFSNSSPAPAAAGVPGQRSAVAAGSAAPGGAGGAGVSGSATDSVRITDTASYLVAAEQTLSDVPIVSSSRVAEVATALANGTYRISGERIANQLLSLERLMPEEPDSAA